MKQQYDAICLYIKTEIGNSQNAGIKKDLSNLLAKITYKGSENPHWLEPIYQVFDKYYSPANYVTNSLAAGVALITKPSQKPYIEFLEHLVFKFNLRLTQNIQFSSLENKILDEGNVVLNGLFYDQNIQGYKAFVSIYGKGHKLEGSLSKIVNAVKARCGNPINKPEYQKAGSRIDLLKEEIGKLKTEKAQLQEKLTTVEVSKADLEVRLNQILEQLKAADSADETFAALKNAYDLAVIVIRKNCKMKWQNYNLR